MNIYTGHLNFPDLYGIVVNSLVLNGDDVLLHVQEDRDGVGLVHLFGIAVKSGTQWRTPYIVLTGSKGEKLSEMIESRIIFTAVEAASCTELRLVGQWQDREDEPCEFTALLTCKGK